MQHFFSKRSSSAVGRLVVKVFQSWSWDPSLHSPFIHLISIWVQINRSMMVLTNTKFNISTWLHNWGSDFGKWLSDEQRRLVGVGFIKRWSPEDHRSWNVPGEQWCYSALGVLATCSQGEWISTLGKRCLEPVENCDSDMKGNWRDLLSLAHKFW